MKLFAHLPVALHAGMTRALLISFGSGSTARALVDTRELEQIDIVDISRDVLDLASVVYPAATNPLRDPRVHTYVEDGRFFLLTAHDRYDLITAEPPPPKIAGVVNLYSLEYFQLLRSRLAEGGMVSYWLPLHSLERGDALAVIGAFCGAFDDCTLWKALGGHWMLVGTRNGRGGTDETRFARSWNDPRVAPEMKRLGFERPEQMGALFIADAPALHELVRGTPPLTDDYPQRLAPYRAAPPDAFAWADDFSRVELTRDRFAQSAWIRRFWPPALRERTLGWFGTQAYYDLWGRRPYSWDEINSVLTGGDLETLPLLMMGVDPDNVIASERALAKGRDTGSVRADLARAALARRSWAEAAEQARLGEARASADEAPMLRFYRSYALALGRRRDEALAIAAKGLPAGAERFLARALGS
jgi:hypothetical protein